MYIMIDPGHGGKDPGAVFCNMVESDINLRAAYFLMGNLFYRAGDAINLYLTRVILGKTEKTPLKQRAGMADGMDLFVSLHCNSCEKENSASGLEIYVYRKSSIAGKVAEAILNTTTLAGINTHGEGIIESRNLYVLKHTTCPALLIEMGYINNKYDQKILGSVTGLAALMDYVAVGILKGVCMNV